MNKPHILVDIDGCVSDVWGTVNKFRRWDRLPALPFPVDYELSNFDERDRAYVSRVFRDPRFYRRARPLPGAKPCLWTLSNYYTINYITARGVTSEGLLSRAVTEVTRIWLGEWEMPEGMTYFTTADNKAKLARERFPNIAFAIEDSVPPAQSYVDEGILTYIVRYPYNESLPDGPLAVGVRDLYGVIHARLMSGELDMKANESVKNQETDNDFGDENDNYNYEQYL